MYILFFEMKGGMFMAQIVMWVFFIGPWLLLFAVDKERVKRYMAVSLFGDVYDYQCSFRFISGTCHESYL